MMENHTLIGFTVFQNRYRS